MTEPAARAPRGATRVRPNGQFLEERRAAASSPQRLAASTVNASVWQLHPMALGPVIASEASSAALYLPAPSSRMVNAW